MVGFWAGVLPRKLHERGDQVMGLGRRKYFHLDSEYQTLIHKKVGLERPKRKKANGIISAGPFPSTDQQNQIPYFILWPLAYNWAHTPHGWDQKALP